MPVSPIGYTECCLWPRVDVIRFRITFIMHFEPYPKCPPAGGSAVVAKSLPVSQFAAELSSQVLMPVKVVSSTFMLDFFYIYFCFSLPQSTSPQLTEFIKFTMNSLGCSIPFLQCFLSIVLQQMLEFTYSCSLLILILNLRNHIKHKKVFC